VTGEQPPRHTSFAETFTSRLNYLFKVAQPGSNNEVARKITESGTSITGEYINLLRGGKRKNPSAGLVQALANFFGVSPLFFFSDEGYREGLRHLAQLKAWERLADLAANPKTALVAASARGLSDEGIVELLQIIEDLLASQADTEPGGQLPQPPP
jgi:transcriptional regulator with XRE-family HTH domain